MEKLIRAGVLRGLLGVLTALVVLRRTASYVEVQGQSMEPLLRHGDAVVAVRVPRAVIPRGAVITGSLPPTAAPDLPEFRSEEARRRLVGGRQFVKVLVGKPGDVVTDGGRVQTLGADEYWVAGIGPVSADSREWGPVAGCHVRALALRGLTRRRRGENLRVVAMRPASGPAAELFRAREGQPDGP